MKLKKDERKRYSVLIDDELHHAIKSAKARGINLQPILREFIRKKCTPTITVK